MALHYAESMRALDLFCCEGGAGTGYARAGFTVEGVDIERQPRYPFPFVQGDVADLLDTPGALDAYDLVHASPPCQDLSGTMAFGLPERGTGWLLAFTLERLQRWATRTGGLYVVENVESRAVRDAMTGASAPFRLCGSAFGLGARDSRSQYRILTRHRLFVTNFPVVAPPCAHRRGDLVGGVYGNGEQGVNGGRGYGFAADAAREALGTPWMTREGAKECIPPAYAEHIGRAALAQVSGAPLHSSS